MCGLTGYWPTENVGNSRTIVQSMIGTLVHRGPDGEGVWVDIDTGLALGHRRLAIVDLSERGSQPMRSACGRFVIAFNGEIYNHGALRTELSRCGNAPKWRGTSDTETLLAACATWGVLETLERTVGMFAFALWDVRKKCLSLARDRFGEKPLYYGWTRTGSTRGFSFGSELKSLRVLPGFDPSIDRGSLSLFLDCSAIPSPYTIYQNCYKLSPGTMLTLTESGVETQRAQVERYWHPECVARDGLKNAYTDAILGLNELEAALDEAVGLQMLADVPVGAFLSGGVDSSLVTALMQRQSLRPVKTFTIGLEHALLNEAPHAARVARHLGTDHHEHCVTPEDALELISLLPETYDEPFGDSSQIPTMLVCRAARSTVTVALTGDGGDELFGGYVRYLSAGRFWKRVERFPSPLRIMAGLSLESLPWSLLISLNKLGFSGDKVLRIAHRLKSVHSPEELYSSLMREWYGSQPPVRSHVSKSTPDGNPDLVAGIEGFEQRMMLWDTVQYLPDDILTKVDRAAMAFGLETRLPMLDHRVASVASRLPIDMKIREGRGKWALRQVLYRYVPPALVDRPKAGFGLPIADWLRGPLRDWAEELLREKRLVAEGYLEAPEVARLWREHQNGHRNWTTRLWNILMFQAWLEKSPDQTPSAKAILRPNAA